MTLQFFFKFQFTNSDLRVVSKCNLSTLVMLRKQFTYIVHTINYYILKLFSLKTEQTTVGQDKLNWLSV